MKNVNKFKTLEINGFRFTVEVKAFRLCHGMIQAKVKLIPVSEVIGQDYLWVNISDLEPNKLTDILTEHDVDFRFENGAMHFEPTEGEKKENFYQALELAGIKMRKS